MSRWLLRHSSSARAGHSAVGGDCAESPVTVQSSSRYQKPFANILSGVMGKDRKGHLDAQCGLGPLLRRCCSERNFGKYQRDFCLPAFSNLNLHEIYIFAPVSGAQKTLRGHGHAVQPHPTLSCPCWGRCSPQNSRHEGLGLLTGKQGDPPNPSPNPFWGTSPQV